MSPKANARQSLCCECGTLRTVNGNYAPRGEYTGYGESPERIAEMQQYDIPYWRDREPYRRCLEILKCATCRRTTEHAMVFPDSRRDINEEEDWAASRAWGEVDRVIDDFRSLGMCINWRDEMKEDLAAGIRQYLDDNSWALEINECVPAERILDALAKLWKVVLEFDANTKWYVHPGREGGWRPDRYVGYSGK